LNQAAIDSKVDDLLSRWHHWRSAYRAAQGYASSDATCRQAVSSGLWDRENGLVDDRAEESAMRAVDNAVERIPNTPQPWCTCLQIHARNLYTGHTVWFSPRLPKEKDELALLLLEARNMLARRLIDVGVIS
jgi:hypothetical protein